VGVRSGHPPMKVQIPQDSVRKWINSSRRDGTPSVYSSLAKSRSSPQLETGHYTEGRNIISAKGSKKLAPNRKCGQSPPFFAIKRLRKSRTFLQQATSGQSTIWMAIRRPGARDSLEGERKASKRACILFTGPKQQLIVCAGLADFRTLPLPKSPRDWRSLTPVAINNGAANGNNNCSEHRRRLR
jgi:hypothetical protein